MISVPQAAACAVFIACCMFSAAALNLDVQTLNSVYVHWGSPTQLASWGASAGNTACNMIGIICNAENNVVSLSLHDIPTGAFDPLLFTLTSLSKLVLVNVKLSGSISLQISQLTGLKEFQASSNLLTGSLPSAVSLLLSLTALEINSNQLTGTIPPQLSTLILLSHLQLGNNKFAGPLPVDLSSLNSLVILYAPFNNLSGTIPPQYSALQQLTAMVLSSNSLNGSIPVQLTSIRNLSLLVRDNQALCGPPLVFGEQASTNVGQDCPDLTSDDYWVKVVIICVYIAPLLVIVYGVFVCYQVYAAPPRSAAVVFPHAAVFADAQPAPIIEMQQQPHLQPPQASELSRFFGPD